MSNVIQRHDNRAYNQMRSIKVAYNLFGYAPGNVLFELGNTKVLCSVTMQKGVPHFLKGTRTGWLTAEYSLLPSATQPRTPREGVILKRNHRSVEISRMIGRALRVVTNLDMFGEQTIMVDCDVLHADGGTRCACITAAYLSLEAASQRWLQDGFLKKPLIRNALAAVSVGVVNGHSLLDLNYEEDSKADADFNVVLTSTGKLIELQGAAERDPLSWQMFDQLRDLASSGINELFKQCGTIEKQRPVEKNRQEKVPLFSLQRRHETFPAK